MNFLQHEMFTGLHSVAKAKSHSRSARNHSCIFIFISCAATLYTMLLVRCPLSVRHTFSQSQTQAIFKLRNDLPVTGLVCSFIFLPENTKCMYFCVIRQESEWTNKNSTVVVLCFFNFQFMYENKTMVHNNFLFFR